MLRTLLLIPVLVLVLAPDSYSQHKYIPFPDSNAIWVIRQLNEMGVETGGVQDFIQKDTTIKGIEYLKVVGSEDSTLLLPVGHAESWFAYRNDTVYRQVYVYDQFANKEYLLYDFSLQEGDTFPKNSYGGVGRYGSSVITNIDTVTIDSNEHLIFYANSPLNGNLIPYIEGIGSLAGNLFPPYFFEGGYELVCFMLGKDRKPYYTSPGLECKLYHYTGVNENELNSLKTIIYPIPITINSVIELQTEGDLIDKLTVYQIDGSKVLERLGLFERKFEIGNFITSPGFYFYHIQTTKGKVAVGKFNF